jgi:dienelactone hydrolase
LTPEEIEAARNRRSITDEQLASITVPAMIIVGTDDASTPVEPNVTRAWEFSNSNPLYRVELVAGQHHSFTNACRYYLDLLPSWSADLQTLTRPLLQSQAAQGCGDGIMDIERAQDLTNTFAITFLESVFRGTAMIDPTTTEIPADIVFMSK